MQWLKAQILELARLDLNLVLSELGKVLNFLSSCSSSITQKSYLYLSHRVIVRVKLIGSYEELKIVLFT